MDQITFEAEIKEVKAYKTASLDSQFSIKFLTDDSSILSLGALPSDKLVRVSVIDEK